MFLWFQWDIDETIISFLQPLPVLITVGPDKGPGQFLLFGEEKQVSQIGPK